ncbi:MAG: glycosyltransferase [Armatimonadetes bacterium]|nr:glycosyltransferase [Armatimonadota bacterium]
MSKAAVLIPAYNEAGRIADTIGAARQIPGVGEVIVIDDGSTDRTFDEAYTAGADRVVQMFKNSGKGAALHAGMTVTSADVLLLLDGDLGASASAAASLLGPVLADEADMTIGVLPASGRPGGLGFAVGLARWGIKRFTGRSMMAPLSGQRALKREIIDRMGGFDPGFGVETGLTIDALRMGYRVEEIPVDLSHRATGRDLGGFLHRGRQFIDIARALAVRGFGLRKGSNER